jgi:hypothetical protein
MSKHTPGPWEVEEGAGEIVICAETGTAIDESICFVTHGGWHEMPRETAIANARLIAAAPELLAVLMQIQRMGYTDWGDKVMVDEVIAKATGESP